MVRKNRTSLCSIYILHGVPIIYKHVVNSELLFLNVAIPTFKWAMLVSLSGKNKKFEKSCSTSLISFFGQIGTKIIKIFFSTYIP